MLFPGPTGNFGGGGNWNDEGHWDGCKICGGGGTDKDDGWGGRGGGTEKDNGAGGGDGNKKYRGGGSEMLLLLSLSFGSCLLFSLYNLFLSYSLHLEV